MFGATDVRDFVDVAEGPLDDEKMLVEVAISAANFAIDDPESDEKAVRGLLTMMYTVPKIALVCRRIVLKAYAENERLEQIWAEVITDVCDKGTVADESVDILWRDYALLAQENKEIIGPAIWKLINKGTGVHAMVSALVS
jgi:hypothetical protein